MKGRTLSKAPKAGKFAKGGRLHVINGEGSPAIEAAKKTSSGGFKRGGKIAKLKTGGMVSGAPAAKRLDKFARGGRMSAKMASGGSPFSSGNKETKRANGGAGAGHEDVG